MSELTIEEKAQRYDMIRESFVKRAHLLSSVNEVVNKCNGEIEKLDQMTAEIMLEGMAKDSPDKKPSTVKSKKPKH